MNDSEELARLRSENAKQQDVIDYLNTMILHWAQMHEGLFKDMPPDQAKKHGEELDQARKILKALVGIHEGKK